MGTGSGSTVVESSTSNSNGFNGTESESSSSSCKLAKANGNGVAPTSDDSIIDGIVPMKGGDDGEVHELMHIRRDFYDQSETANTVLYVKNIVTNSLKVIFESSALTVMFRSTDEQFLALNGCKTPETVFRWSVPNLRGEIIPSKCHYSLTEKKLEIKLKKATNSAWSSIYSSNSPAPPATTRPATAPVKKVSLELPTTPSVKITAPKEAPATYANGSNGNSSNGTSSVKQNSSSNNNNSPKISLDDSYIASTSTSSSKLTASPPSLSIDVSNANGNGSPSSSLASQYRSRSGMRGLVNQSNNCYQNSVIQILANTPHLRDYCLNGFTESDINRTNPLGSKGRMVIEFIRLIRDLWGSSSSDGSTTASSSSSVYMKYAPIDTAQSVGLVAAQRFRPFVQHDAQEFVTYLLDTIHEDLNKGYGVPTNKAADESDPTAETAWASFLRRNDSPLVNMFYGQICNKITCQHCFKESNAYDPFMMLPLPIARPSKSVDLMCLYVPTMLSRDQPCLISLSVPACITSEEIKQEIRNHLNTSHVTCELKLYANLPVPPSSTGLGHFWRASDVHSLTRRSVRRPNSVDVLIYETQPPSSKKPVVTIHVIQMLSNSAEKLLECAHCKKKASAGDLPRCTRCQAVAYCGTECQKTHWKSHKVQCVTFEQSIGVPLCFTVSLSISFEKFVKQVEAGVKRFVEVTCQEHSLMKHAVFQLAPDDAADRKAKQQPPKEEVNAANFHSVLQNASKSIVKLRMVWLNGRAGQCHLQLNEVRLAQFPISKAVVPVSQDRVSLNDCFRLYFEPELMHSANAWMCPACKKNRTAIQRSLISRYPRYLIAYIKRFSQDGYVHKDREHVCYPSVLDVSPFVADEALPVTGEALGRQRQNSSQQLPPILYNLYGVVNHYGTMQFGHYSSYARLPALTDANASEVAWRVFDDELVEETSPSRVVDLPDAYILFYQLQEQHLQTAASTVKSKNGHPIEADKVSMSSAATSSGIGQSLSCVSVEEDGEDEDDDDDEDAETISTTVASPPTMNDLLLSDDTVD